MFVHVSENLSSQFTDEDEWQLQPERSIPNQSSFYQCIRPHCEDLRRIVLKGIEPSSNGTWHCTVQFELRRTQIELFADFQDTREGTGTTQFVKEVLLFPGICSMLSGRALTDSRLLNNVVAGAIDANEIVKEGKDKLIIVFGEWQTNGLFDGLAWKNSSSVSQREAASPTLPVKKLTTLMPKTSHIPLKKYHVAVNGFTYIYYHFISPEKNKPEKKAGDKKRKSSEPKAGPYAKKDSSIVLN